MASIRRSARIESIRGTCGHKVDYYVPPGNMGRVGQRNQAEAAASMCDACRREETISAVLMGPPNILLDESAEGMEF